MFGHILVALDGSEHARKAAEIGTDLAAKYGARLTFLTVTKAYKISAQARRYMELENLLGEPKYVIDEMTAAILDGAKDRARAEGLADFRTVAKEGAPARTIVDYAKREACDLIVMGSRGMGDLEAALLGSVAHTVSRLAPCTVITVK